MRITPSLPSVGGLAGVGFQVRRPRGPTPGGSAVFFSCQKRANLPSRGEHRGHWGDSRVLIACEIDDPRMVSGRTRVPCGARSGGVIAAAWHLMARWCPFILVITLAQRVCNISRCANKSEDFPRAQVHWACTLASSAWRLYTTTSIDRSVAVRMRRGPWTTTPRLDNWFTRRRLA